MKAIKLTQGATTVVDDDSYEKFGHMKWYLGPGGYASRYSKRKVVFLHREIMNHPKGYLVDHINHNKLDNTKENLRKATSSENSFNRKSANKNNNSTGVRGVYYEKISGYYKCDITKNGVRKRTTVKNLEKAKQVVESWIYVEDSRNS